MSVVVDWGYFVRDLLVLVFSVAIIAVLLEMGAKIRRNLGFSGFIRAFNVLIAAFFLVGVAQIIGVLLRTVVLNNDPTYLAVRSVLLLIGALLLFLSSVMIYLPFARGRYMIVPIAVEPVDSLNYGGYWGSQEKCESTFVNLVRRYRLPGLAVSRDPPEVFRKKLGLKIIPVIWVSKVPHGEAVTPTRLSYLLDKLRRFLESADMDKVIFIDCVEYLILENGEEAVLKFLTTLKDISVLNRGIIIVTLDREALSGRIFNILSSELLPVENLEEQLKHDKK
ncbi:DUF835 domain-containing protein [Thermococcus sp. 21S7]|uniref:DUF835 domain-containing protein n=1 Tax=Thermococcus sp. 21S7 TaxID=1638221 RepID=UPI00143BCCC1|nr:DUF835 domain-containing protein [Thermococcus sp. 21S7]NJE60738.1 DUF835 domain-containing protein [Thermococcus sp. 21S7]